MERHMYCLLTAGCNSIYRHKWTLHAYFDTLHVVVLSEKIEKKKKKYPQAFKADYWIRFLFVKHCEMCLCFNLDYYKYFHIVRGDLRRKSKLVFKANYYIEFLYIKLSTMSIDDALHVDCAANFSINHRRRDGNYQHWKKKKAYR